MGRWGRPWGPHGQIPAPFPPGLGPRGSDASLSPHRAWTSAHTAAVLLCSALVSGRGRLAEGGGQGTLTSARWRHLACAVCSGLVSKLAKAEATARWAATARVLGLQRERPAPAGACPPLATAQIQDNGLVELGVSVAPLPLPDVFSTPTCGHGTLQMVALGGESRAPWGN